MRSTEVRAGEVSILATSLIGFTLNTQRLEQQNHHPRRRQSGQRDTDPRVPEQPERNPPHDGQRHQPEGRQPHPAQRTGRLFLRLGMRRRNIGRKLADAGDHDRTVVRPAAQIGQLHQQSARLTRRQFPHNRPDLGVRNLIAQAIGAQEKRVLWQHDEWAFQIDLHRRFRTQRPQDDVAMVGEVELLRRLAIPAAHLPFQAVVERQLIDPVAAYPVTAAVADVPQDGPLGRERQHGAGGPHPLKLFVLLPLLEDRGVGGHDRSLERDAGVGDGAFEVGMRDGFGGNFAGEFPHRMPAHPVRDEEQMPAPEVFLLGLADLNGVRILIVLAAHADIRERGVLNFLLPAHAFPPELCRWS